MACTTAGNTTAKLPEQVINTGEKIMQQGTPDEQRESESGLGEHGGVCEEVTGV